MGLFANSEDPDKIGATCGILSGSPLFAKVKFSFRESNTIFCSTILTSDPSIYTMDHLCFIVCDFMEDFISLKRVIAVYFQDIV